MMMLTNERKTMWKFGLIGAIVVIQSITWCGVLANEHRHANSRRHQTTKYTIEELLSSTYPYSDPRTDHQLDMDPCKSGKMKMLWQHVHVTSYLTMSLKLFYLPSSVAQSSSAENKTIFISFPAANSSVKIQNCSRMMFNSLILCDVIKL